MGTERQTPEPTAGTASRPFPIGAGEAEAAVEVSRLIDAPPERVFKAWTEPERLKRWWAPKGWTTPYVTVEPRPGGLFHYCMLAPDGREVWGRGIYHEVAPGRLVYADAFADEQGHAVEPARYGVSAGYPTETLVAADFADQDGKTLVTLQHVIPDTVAERADLAHGWSEMLDRLANDAEALAAESATAVGRRIGAMQVELAANETRFTRLIAAPREAVFRAWTDPMLLAKWWGPHGFTNPVCQADVRPGGAYRIVMRSPEGVDYPVTGIYREVAEPERLVFTDQADELPADWLASFNAARGAAPDAAPPMTVVTVGFADEGGRTLLSVRGEYPSAAARDAILKMGAAEGWAQSFERLEALFTRPVAAPGNAEATREHRWLQQLVGEWTFEGEATMDPQMPPEKFQGTERVHAVGDFWIVAEGQGEMPGGGTASLVMTLGYDPVRGRFVGTFIGSMMTHLWLYDGALDADATVLTLDSEGPNMAAPGTIAKYQDIIELRDENHRVMRSQMLGTDGSWREVMRSEYRRMPNP